MARVRRTGRARAAAARAGSLRAKPLGVITKPLKAISRAAPVIGAGFDYLEGRSLGEDRTRAAVGAAGSAAGGWYGAGQGALGGAALGTLTGPAAPIASPILAVGGAIGGGLIGSGVGGWAADRVDGLIRGDRGAGRQRVAMAQSVAPQQMQYSAPQQPAQSWQPNITPPPPSNQNQGQPGGLPTTGGLTPIAWGGLALGAGTLVAGGVGGRMLIGKASKALRPVAQRAAASLRSPSGATIAGDAAAAAGSLGKAAGSAGSAAAGVAGVGVQAAPKVAAAAKPAAKVAAVAAAGVGGAAKVFDDGVAKATAKGGFFGRAAKAVQNLTPTGILGTTINEGVKAAIAIPIISRLGLGARRAVVPVGVAAAGVTLATAANNRVNREFGTQAAWWDDAFFGGAVNRTFGEKGSKYLDIEARERTQNRTQDTRLRAAGVIAQGQVESARLRSQAVREAAQLRYGGMGANGQFSGQVRVAEINNRGASDRQRVQTGGQVRVAEIGANAGIAKQRIQTGGQVRVADLTTARNLQGRVYEADAGVKRQAIQTGGR
jgi:hypothetical protein